MDGVYHCNLLCFATLGTHIVVNILKCQGYHLPHKVDFIFPLLNKCQQLSLLSPSLCELVIQAAFGSSEWPFGPPQRMLHRFPGMLSNFWVVGDFSVLLRPHVILQQQAASEEAGSSGRSRRETHTVLAALQIHPLSPHGCRNFYKVLRALVWNLHREQL